MTCTWAPFRRPSARPQRSELVEAPWEYTTVLCADLERALNQFDPTARDLLLAAHQAGHPLCRLYSGQPTARTAGSRHTVDALLGQLVAAMNGQHQAYRKDTSDT